MKTTIRQMLMDNIVLYEDAVESLTKKDGPNISKTNKVKAYFHIITCMRNRYGCPYCNSKPKCSCSVVSPKPDFVTWKDGDTGPNLW